MTQDETRHRALVQIAGSYYAIEDIISELSELEEMSRVMLLHDAALYRLRIDKYIERLNVLSRVIDAPHDDFRPLLGIDFFELAIADRSIPPLVLSLIEPLRRREVSTNRIAAAERVLNDALEAHNRS